MPTYSFVLPPDFDEYEWEVTAKRWFAQSLLTVSGKRYRLNFYDATRLKQEVESELARGEPFFEPNLIVIPSVSRSDMERAADFVVRSGQTTSLVPE